MNEINQFFLAGDKFMPEIHLRQPGFMYSACRTCSKNKERMQKFKDRRFTTLYLSKPIRQSLLSA